MISLSPYTLLTLTPCLDFYNYFRYGIDFLISGKTHVVEKIVLHTNIVRLSSVNRFLRLTFAAAWLALIPTL